MNRFHNIPRIDVFKSIPHDCRIFHGAPSRISDEEARRRKLLVDLATDIARSKARRKAFAKAGKAVVLLTLAWAIAWLLLS